MKWALGAFGCFKEQQVWGSQAASGSTRIKRHNTERSKWENPVCKGRLRGWHALYQNGCDKASRFLSFASAAPAWYDVYQHGRLFRKQEVESRKMGAEPRG